MTVEWIVAGLAGALVGVLVGLVFYWRRASAMAQALARLQDAQARNSALEASEGNLRVQLQDALEQASEQQRRASSLAADNARLEERLSGTTEKLQWLEQSRASACRSRIAPAWTTCCGRSVSSSLIFAAGWMKSTLKSQKPVHP